MRHLVIFGFGYAASAFARHAAARFDRVSATTRGRDKAQAMAMAGVVPMLLDGSDPGGLGRAVADATAVLVSIPPDETGDTVLRHFRQALGAAPRLGWIGYYSTVGVYGDHRGAWVDEATPVRPVSRRSVQRARAEEDWRGFAAQSGIPVAILRLAGIYGPGRNAFVNLAEGTAKRLVKSGQVFNRIHVEDIAAATEAAMLAEAGGVFNVADDEPAPPQDVVAFAAALMGVPPPPETPFEAAELTPMARSFYGENKRVANAATKAALGLRWRHPTYREGLEALWRDGNWRGTVRV